MNLEKCPGSVTGSIYVKTADERGRVIAEFFGHDANKHADAFIRVISEVVPA